MGFFNLFKSKPASLEPTKNDISDFFKIDINNLFQYNPIYSHSETNTLGEKVKHYNIRLKELELGVFYEIEILKFEGNECTLIFKGRSNTLTPELKEFIDFCGVKYGLDNSGYGKIESSDYGYIERHLFSRMWEKVWIDNSAYNDYNGNIIMTIFSVIYKDNIKKLAENL